MMGGKDKAQVHAKVNKRTKELAKQKLGHGGLTELIETELERVAHGTKVSERERVKDELESLRSDRQDKIIERNNLNDEIDELNRKIERLEEKLDRIQDRQGEYEGALKMLKERMEEDQMRVFEGHGQVKEAAEIGGCTQEDVIDDLKERVEDIPEWQFTMGTT